MLSTLMFRVNEHLAGSGSSVKPPEISLNRPGTDDSPRWPILKVTPEWTGSTAYSSARAGAATNAAKRTPGRRNPGQRLSMCFLLVRKDSLHKATTSQGLLWAPGAGRAMVA